MCRPSSRRVRFYGEGEEVIVERLASEGRDFLGRLCGPGTHGHRLEPALSGQRRWSPSTRPKARSGPTIRWRCSNWARRTDADDDNAVTDNQRQTYQAFADFLTDPATQQKLLTAGYRPADLSIALDGADSPFAGSRPPSTGASRRPPCRCPRRRSSMWCAMSGTTPNGRPTSTWWSTHRAAWAAANCAAPRKRSPPLSSRSRATRTRSGWSNLARGSRISGRCARWTSRLATIC